MADHDELAMLRVAVAGSLGAAEASGADAATTWRRVSEIGWAEAFTPGGTSRGVAEAALVGEECGRGALPLSATPLVVGAAAVMRAPDHRSGLVDRTTSGREPLIWADLSAALDWAADFPQAVVPGLDLGSHLLVTRGFGDEPVATLLVVDDLGDAARRIETIDGGSPTWAVRVDGLTSASGRWPVDTAFLRQLTMVVAASQAAGLLDRALQATVEYAGDRTAFGRPIGSFQAVKHHLADVKVGLEVARALVADAVERLDADMPHAELACVAAAHHSGRAALEGLQLCVQVHGGIGVTMECELHALIRRATALRFLYLEPFATDRRLVELHEREVAAHA